MMFFHMHMHVSASLDKSFAVPMPVSNEHGSAKAHLVFFNPAESMIRNIIRKRLKRPCCGPYQTASPLHLFGFTKRNWRNKQKLEIWGASLPSTSDHHEYFEGFCAAISVGSPVVFPLSTGVGDHRFNTNLKETIQDLGNGSWIRCFQLTLFASNKCATLRHGIATKNLTGSLANSRRAPKQSYAILRRNISMGMVRSQSCPSGGIVCLMSEEVAWTQKWCS